MEENNRKGPGVFYAVVGVATLVVAIIGATFAFFSATATANNEVEGNAATIGLSVTLEKVSTEATGGLVPIADGTSTKPGYTNSLLNNALNATKMCVDTDGNTVCQVYHITVKNEGNAPARLDGTLTMTATGYTNLKWANMNVNAGIATATTPESVGSVLNFVNGETAEDAITTAELYEAEETKHYYIMVYIAETGEAQNESDKGSFNGTVTFNSAGGNGTTATFAG